MESIVALFLRTTPRAWQKAGTVRNTETKLKFIFLPHFKLSNYLEKSN